MGFCRKLLRRCFYAAAALSTLLLLATLILWPVSYFVCVGVVYWKLGSGQYAIDTESGLVMMQFIQDPWDGFNGLHVIHEGIPPGYGRKWSYFTWDARDAKGEETTTLGVLLGRHKSVPSDALIGIPLSYLAILLSVLPLLAFRAMRRRRRAARNVRLALCPKCGYDLRAHAAGGRCPECGTPIAKAGPGQPWSGGEAPAA